MSNQENTVETPHSAYNVHSLYIVHAVMYVCISINNIKLASIFKTDKQVFHSVWRGKTTLM